MKKIPKKDWEDCPYCDNTGMIVKFRQKVFPLKNAKGKTTPISTLEPSPHYEKCFWCRKNPKSIYNQKKLREKEKDVK